MGSARLYFYYGAMGSSKTAQALMVRFNYEERGQKALIVKPSTDTREGKSIVRSRIGLEYPCIYFNELEDKLKQIYSSKSKHAVNDILGYDVIIIDEAQFLDANQVMELVDIVDNFNIPVMCYGLLSDFKGNLFPGSEKLVIMADKLVEIKAVCWCGRKATFNARLDERGKIVKSGEQILVGANDKYIGLCRKHWRLGQLGPNLSKGSD